MRPAGEQLELDLEVGDPPHLAEVSRRAVVRVGAGLLDWAPVWVPVLVLLQLGLGGLRPALTESRRLDAAEASVHDRVDRLLRERARLVEDGERLDDPIYQERVRRSLRVPGGAPLTLDRARELDEAAARLEAEARARDLSPAPASGTP